MSGKSDRRIRKCLNRFRTDRQKLSDSLVAELLNAPFRYRLRFALAVVFHRRHKNG